VAAAAIAAAGRHAAAEVTEESGTTAGLEPGIARTVLPSGIRVVTERMPDASSVSIGVWVAVGSRDEPAELAGASHFLEHLLFKGTDGRTARSIALAVDAVGGDFNAFTAREHTAFYTRLPAAHLALGLELLTDVVMAPALRPAELEAEREVILEEILMSEDLPDELVGMALYEGLFPGHALGRETLGTPDTIGAMRRSDVADFHARWYRPANVVVAVAGRLHHDQVVDALGGFLVDGERGGPPPRSAPTGAVAPRTVLTRPTEQVHVMYGWRSLDHDDPDRYALSVANHVLGGGMSSRLFTEVREERGLSYTVCSGASGYQGAGSMTVYAGTAPQRLPELLDVLDEVLAGIVADGITDEEHRVALGYLEGALLLGLEDSGSRMGRLGTGEVVRGEVVPVAEHVARIRAVTPDDVARALRRVLGGDRTLAVVGPMEADDPVLDR
jgi:predicted Zn-dependent peptidase